MLPSKGDQILTEQEARRTKWIEQLNEHNWKPGSSLGLGLPGLPHLMRSVVWHIISDSTRYQLRTNLWDTEGDIVFLSNMRIGRIGTSTHQCLISACWRLPEAHAFNQSEWILSLYKCDPPPRNKWAEIMQHAYRRYYMANADSPGTHEPHVLGSQESQLIQTKQKESQLQHDDMTNDARIEIIEKSRKPEDSWKAKSRG